MTMIRMHVAPSSESIGSANSDQINQYMYSAQRSPSPSQRVGVPPLHVLIQYAPAALRLEAVPVGTPRAIKSPGLTWHAPQQLLARRPLRGLPSRLELMPARRRRRYLR